MRTFRHPLVSINAGLVRGTGLSRQSGPLNHRETLCPTLRDRPLLRACKRGTVGMSSRTVVDAKRTVREASRQPAVSTTRSTRQHSRALRHGYGWGG